MELQRKEEEKKQFKSGVAKFYDEFSGQWEHIYESDHIHHGFYDPNSTEPVDHHSARIRMLEEAIRFANISEDPSKRPKSIIDVGCGIGGTSRYLAKKYGASCVGITLSPVQAERANTLAAAQGLTDKVSFRVADALEQPFSDGKFDLLWSMESAEYMPDKEKDIKTEDWSIYAAPTWPALIRSALSWTGFISILTSART